MDKKYPVMYWSRIPGDFVNKLTGAAASGGSFTGTIREWYETLSETCIDLTYMLNHCESVKIDYNFDGWQQKLLEGLKDVGYKIFVSSDILTILECSILYHPRPILQENGLEDPQKPKGCLCNKFMIYQNLYVPRNEVVITDFKMTKVGKVVVLNMDVI